MNTDIGNTMNNRRELTLKQREDADKAWKRANPYTPLADIPDNEEEN